MTLPRILIVEDEAILAAHLSLSLAQLGYAVAGQAATGETAVALALRENPEAILMDIRLRGEMTGLEAAEKIRQSRDVPIVFLTAYAEEAVLQRAKATEAYAVLSKPVREQELRSTLEMALYKHGAETRLKHLHQVLRAVRDVTGLLTREKNADRLLEEACRILAGTRGYALVWVGRPVEEGHRILPVAHAGGHADYLENLDVTWDDVPRGRGPSGTAARERRVSVCRDFANDPRTAPWREAALGRGFASSASIPIMRGDNLYGLLTVYAEKIDFFDDEEVALLTELASDLAYALDALEAEAARRKAEERLSRSERQLREAFQASIRALSTAIEMRDPYTAGHQERVTRLAAAVAEEMGLDEDRIVGIRIAGSVHDIGKMSIPAEILSKPTKLSAVEYSLIQTHPRTGSDILKNIRFPWPIARIVLQHHERLDGKGYPDGASGEEILLEARIIAVSDVVEAISSHRPYRAALGLDKALDEIRKGRGSAFDPDVVDACIRVVGRPGFSLE